jgi:hypothetical protein
MSSYISVDNQKMLWNTIQRVQLLHERLPENQQQEWFKKIIGMFYKVNINSQYDLVQLNKETIRYMIESLKQKPNSHQDYDKPVTHEPNFKEPINDSVIENMDELLQQQLKQRELDVSQFGAMPNNVDTSIRKDMEELRRIIKILQDEIAFIKSKLPADTKEVTE